MLPQVLEISETIVVGRVNGQNFGINTLKDWVKNAWATVMDQLPSVQTLSKGWFML
jgi:hypothetical protein